MAMVNAAQVRALHAAFPDVDEETVEDALEGCNGDVQYATAILHDILAEEALAAAALHQGPSSILGALLDAVSHIAQCPEAHAPAGGRKRLMDALDNLEAQHDIQLKGSVILILDGIRDEDRLTAGLDAADSEIIRQMLRLCVDGSAVPSDELSPEELRALQDEVGQSAERVAMDAKVKSQSTELTKKEQGLHLLKAAVIKQRLKAGGDETVATP